MTFLCCFLKWAFKGNLVFFGAHKKIQKHEGESRDANEFKRPIRQIKRPLYPLRSKYKKKREKKRITNPRGNNGVERHKWNDLFGNIPARVHAHAKGKTSDKGAEIKVERVADSRCWRDLGVGEGATLQKFKSNRVITT